MRPYVDGGAFAICGARQQITQRTCVFMAAPLHTDHYDQGRVMTSGFSECWHTWLLSEIKLFCFNLCISCLVTLSDLKGAFE